MVNFLDEKHIRIGTSGWSYKDWIGNFYPEHTKSIDFLKYYAEKFSTVEVNSSFYHTLKDKTIVNWINETTDDFVFSVKADRYITHIKKLENPEALVPDFLQSLNPFKSKLGPILFQLPPSFGFNEDRLKSFISILPSNHLYVFEFRNKTWFNEQTYKILKDKNIAVCLYNIKGYQSPIELTADFTYIRYHGTNGLGVGKYNKEDIQKLSDFIKETVSKKARVYCYFNNSANGTAAENASELINNLS